MCAEVPPPRVDRLRIATGADDATSFTAALGIRNVGEATAKEGQQVRQGDRIGHFRRVAKGPASLHFELRQNGQPADPTRLLPPR